MVLRIALVLILPLLGILYIILLGERHKNLRDGGSIAVSALEFLIISSMIPGIMGGKTFELALRPLLGITPQFFISFKVDALGGLFGTLVSMLWLVSIIYSIGYMRGLKEHKQTRFYAFFTLAILSAIGTAFSGNLLTFYVFYEIMTFSTYPLIIHDETREAMASGKWYLGFLITAEAFVLFSIVLTIGLTGNIEFKDGGFLSGYGTANLQKALFLTFIIGFSIKAAVIPLHRWLPKAMVAPTPVSGLLHAVAVVNVGIFGIIRTIYNIFGADLVRELGLVLPMAIWVSISMIIASILALGSDNLKVRLAYSTICQLSYIILGVLFLNPLALMGGIVHIAHQGLMKITLFYCAGALLAEEGIKNVGQMSGVGKSMPYVMLGYTICAVGIFGMPFTCGFVTKWYICLGILEAGYPAFIGIIILSSFFEMYYLINPAILAFFEKGSYTKRKRSPWLLVPILFCAAATVVLGIIPWVHLGPLSLAEVAAENLLGGV